MKRIIITGDDKEEIGVLAKSLQDKNLVQGIRYTTEQRGYALDTIDEHTLYVSYSYFSVLKEEGAFFITSDTSTVRDGFLNHDWESKDVFVLTTKEVKSIPKHLRDECCFVYVGKNSAKHSDLNFSIIVEEPITKKIVRKITKSSRTAVKKQKESMKTLSFLSYLLVIGLPIAFVICLPFMWKEYIEGDTLLSIVVIALPILISVFGVRHLRNKLRA